jgi:hypothetical protein
VRDINRIPEILEELERVWRDNLDSRLCQLLTVASKPSSPHSTTFYIEDEKMLEGLKSLGEKKANSDEIEPLWMKHSEIGNMEPESLTVNHLRDLILELNDRNEQLILAPESILGIIGAPITDKGWMNTQQPRLNKLKQLLATLETEEILKSVHVEYKINKVPNNGYKA